MDYRPLVTIVIPVYNGTNYLREAIDCALSQTYKNIEIIVVNDGSTDCGETDALARSYGQAVRYFSKENGGVSSALNLAVSHMKGEWFSWLSHDDLYYPEKIEKQIAFLNKLLREDPDVDLKRIAVHCATESIDKDGKVIKRPSYRDVPEKENSIDTIIGNIFNYRLSGCSFLIPADCFTKIGGFREDIRTVSDVEFWYRLLLSGYTFYCMKNDILVQNRSHGKQVGKTKVGLFEKELNSLYREIADRMREKPEFSGIRQYESMYYGLRKRHINETAAYVREKYLRGRAFALRYHVVMPVKASLWTLSGSMRNMARAVYRRIFVK